jgi:hypothetical protein
MYVYCNGFILGRFSCLEGIVKLRRSIGYHLVQSFIPTGTELVYLQYFSGMIVCISWVSFFIDRQAVPARVTLSFTTLLSLSTLVGDTIYALCFD